MVWSIWANVPARMRNIASASRTTVRRSDAKGARSFLTVVGIGDDFDSAHEGIEVLFLSGDGFGSAGQLEEPEIAAGRGRGDGDEHAFFALRVFQVDFDAGGVFG